MPREKTYYLGTALSIQVEEYGLWDMARDAAQAVFAAFCFYVAAIIFWA